MSHDGCWAETYCADERDCDFGDTKRRVLRAVPWASCVSFTEAARRGLAPMNGEVFSKWLPVCTSLAISAMASSVHAQDVVPHHPERGGIGLDVLNGNLELQDVGPVRTFPTFDRRLSLFVTDAATVRQLSFQDVMAQLVSEGEDSGLTPLKLFQQWWDTANIGPGTVPAPNPHCDDEKPAAGGLSQLNDFPYRCPRPEHQEASSDPFVDADGPNGYAAIALVNRFDLASTAGADRGEHRVIFARNSGRADALNRNLIIFEARVPNPKKELGIDGCRPIVEFWLKLSDPSLSTVARGSKLREFYLNGLPDDGVLPVIRVDNFVGDAGQIRTNQFLDQDKNFDWTLREFKIKSDSGSLHIVPVTVKTNPGNELLVSGTKEPRAAGFADEVSRQVRDLLGGAGGVSNINTFSFNVHDSFNSFESDERDSELGDVSTAFAQNPGGALRTKIQNALDSEGSTVTADEVVNRMSVLTCAGCHHFANDRQLGGGIIWPRSLDFTYVSEGSFETGAESGPDGPNSRFVISSTLKDVLLPAREEVMKAFLQRFSTDTANQ